MMKSSAELERLVEAVTSAVLNKMSVEKVPAARGNLDLAAMIDHTLLKPDASHDQIKKLCEEAKQYKFATVCVNSSNVGLAAQLLSGSSVKPIAVVGFPLGASTPGAK